MRLSVPGIKDATVGFEPLPNGEYELMVDKVNSVQKKSGDGTTLAWEFTVNSGEFQGRKLWKYTPTTVEGASITKELVVACGADIGDDNTFDDDDCRGSLVRAQVEQEEYEGVIRNRVKKVWA